MRIIAGQFRGRILAPPQGDATRPITDRVKQSLFDILTPLLPDAVVYDCFAGTGSMGLECLSRGAGHVTFFEADRSAIQGLKRNIAALGVGQQSRLVAGDLFKWFKTSAGANAAVSSRQTPVNLIFLDPPYRFLTERTDDLRLLAEQMKSFHLASDGLMIFRHEAGDELEFPSLHRHDVRMYGRMMLEFLSPGLSPANDG